MRAPAGTLRFVVGALAVVVAGPVLLALLGRWNAPGAALMGWMLQVHWWLGELVEGTELLPEPFLGLPILLGLAGAAAFGLGRRFAAAVLGLSVLLGAVGVIGLLAVAIPIDPALFCGGAALLATVGARGRLGARSGAAALAFTGLGIAFIGALTVLEGPGVPSPPFRLRPYWLSGLGAAPWRALGTWWGIAVVGAVCSSFVLRGTESRRPWALVVGGAVVGIAAAASASSAPERLRVDAGLSALAILLWVPVFSLLRAREGVALAPWVSLALRPLPLLAFATAAALRGLAVWMWTPPAALPPAVEWLSWRPGTFAVVAEGRDGPIHWTDREHTLVARREPDGTERRYVLRDTLDAVEELSPPVDGRLWVAGGRFRPEAHMGLLDVRVEGVDGAPGPRGSEAIGEFRPLERCYPSAWIPLGHAAAARASMDDHDVVLGCEGAGDLLGFDPRTGEVGPRIPLGEDVESGWFSADGSRLYTVSLWSGSDLVAWRWPDGAELRRRRVGPFNWSVVGDGRGTLWVTRFFEGGILALDEHDLAVRDFVRLSFGVRALLFEPIHDRLWAAAAYSGRIWEIDARDTSRRRAWALCGQARNLWSDASGRVLVGTDCGLFRIDPEKENRW